MRIKSKFELNFVHVAVLAICPLISLTFNFNVGITLMLLSLISFVFSNFICFVLTKNSSKNFKIFITALISSLVVVGYELLAKNGFINSIGAISYYSVLSSIVLCIDSYYINAKGNRNFLKAMRLLTVYAVIFVIYATLKEILAFGTLSNIKLFKNFAGYEFFRFITFDFVLLGLMCAITDRLCSYIIDVYNDRVMVYNKYKEKIRSEKTFLYENYRRKKLLSSPVTINKIGQNNNDNDEECVEEKIEEEIEHKPKEKPRKSEIKHKPKRKNKLRVSKEAKVEKIFDRKSNLGGQNNA